MNRRALQILVLTVVAGLMAPALSAQNPPPKKPPAPPERHAPPTPPPAPPGTGAPGTYTPCHSIDFAAHMDSPRALMTSCLHKSVQLGSETNDYVVESVNDAGFVLSRQQGGNNGVGGQVWSKFVPWTAVLYYNMAPGFLQVALVRQ